MLRISLAFVLFFAQNRRIREWFVCCGTLLMYS